MDKGAVGEVSVTAGADIKKVMITVEREGSLPSSIGEPDTDVYEYEDVTVYYADESDLSGGTFSFKVKKMKRKIVLIAGLVLLAVALVAIPASAGYNQGGNTGGCHGAHAYSQDCAQYSYVNGQCTGNSCQIAENYCFPEFRGILPEQRHMYP